MLTVYFLLYLISLLDYFTDAHITDVYVETHVGTFVGFRKNVAVGGKVIELSTFLGIPYAEAPVGNLRLRKPVAKSVLKDPLIVQVHGAECIQIHVYPVRRLTSEDCLFLNIYAPIRDENDEKLAVMVWIHGGAFIYGSSNIYVGDILAASGSVIIVTINYRLSILGFLNVGDSNSPSNFGLWDQQMAIKWVHDNIEAFGGDKDRVTLFGESAGAASVLYQGLFPGNKGLFQRIIAESGSSVAPWAFTENEKADADDFAALVGCKKDTVAEMLDCLRHLSEHVINSTINDVTHGLLRFPITFVPSIDNDFVTVTPNNMLDLESLITVSSNQIATLASFDLLTGINSGEGAAGALNPLFGFSGNPNEFMPNRTYFEHTLIPQFVKTMFGVETSDILTDFIIAEYTEWNDPENLLAIRDQYIELYGDVFSLAPMCVTLGVYTHASQKDPYVYYFNATPSSHVMPTPSWFHKTNHADEMQYVFGGATKFSEWGQKGTFDKWENVLSRRVMMMWTNFAKTGDPNIPRDTEVVWQPYKNKSQQALEITRELDSTRMKERLFERRAHFWNKLIPSMMKETLSCDNYSKEANGLKNNCS